MALDWDNTIPSFASTDDRDARYADWLATGATMINGLYCHVQGIGLQVYKAGAWQTVRR